MCKEIFLGLLYFLILLFTNILIIKLSFDSLNRIFFDYKVYNTLNIFFIKNKFFFLSQYLTSKNIKIKDNYSVINNLENYIFEDFLLISKSYNNFSNSFQLFLNEKYFFKLLNLQYFS
jgi:sulfur relay (sulfurtransferase) DsrF/TusC family protein